MENRISSTYIFPNLSMAEVTKSGGAEALPAVSVHTKNVGRAPTIDRRRFLATMVAAVATAVSAKDKKEDNEKEDKPVKLELPKDIADKLKKAGDKVDLSPDDGGVHVLTVNIGGKEVPATFNLGEKGKARLALEEVEVEKDKKETVLVLRFSRPDDNAPVTFNTKVAPKLKQMAFLVGDDVQFAGGIYAGIQKEDGVHTAPIPMTFSHDGKNNDKQTGPLFFVQPTYEKGDVKADGTYGFFISSKDGTKFGDVAVVLGLTTWEKSKEKEGK